MGGIFSEPKILLANLAANCQAFQTFVEVENAEDAKEKIFTEATDVIENFTKFAIITFDDGNWSARKESVNGGIATYEIKNAVVLIIEKILDHEITRIDQLAFETETGAIIQEMMELSEPSNNYVLISDIDLLGFEGDNNIENPRLTAHVKFSWD